MHLAVETSTKHGETISHRILGAVIYIYIIYANMTGVYYDGIHGAPYIAAPSILWGKVHVPILRNFQVPNCPIPQTLRDKHKWNPLLIVK
jgi:hypothetical protein